MNHIEQLAQRLADDPFFLAAALHRFAASAGLDDSALAVRLRCAPEVLTLLRLCRMPRSESPAFGRDVDTIAARFGLDGDALAEMVRYGQGLLRFQARPAPASPEAPGFLMAARDQPPPQPPAGDSP